MNNIKIEKVNRIIKSFSSLYDLSKKIKNSGDGGLQLYKDFFTDELNTNINLINFYKVYSNGIQAITNVNLKINNKEFVCFLGPSGCGKTTLLRMIAGLEEITKGKFKSNNKLMNMLPPGKRGLSMVFQNYALYPYMNVYDNIAFGLKIKKRKNQTILSLKELAKNIRKPFKNEIKNIVYEIKTIKLREIMGDKFDEEWSINLVRRFWLKIMLLRFIFFQLFKNNYEIKKLNLKRKDLYLKQRRAIKGNRKEIQKNLRNIRFSIKILKKIWMSTIRSRINATTRLMGIDDYLRRKPADLSGGQRQRVALSRAITKQSRIFLFDEPLSNLDAKLRAKMRSEIRGLHNKLGATSIYVTHDQIEAMTMADKVVVMNKGYIMQIDSPKNLFDNPTSLFVAKFVGTPEINIFKGRITNGELRTGKTKIKISSGKLEQNVEDQEVNIGIRPQHVHSHANIVEHATENIFNSKVISQELMGDTFLTTIEIKDIGILKCVVSEYLDIKKDSTLKVFIDFNKIHVFSKVNGRTLTTKISKENLVSLKNWDNGRGDRIKNKKLIFSDKEKRTLGQKIMHFTKKVCSSHFRKAEISRIKKAKKEFYVE